MNISCTQKIMARSKTPQGLGSDTSFATTDLHIKNRLYEFSAIQFRHLKRKRIMDEQGNIFILIAVIAAFVFILTRKKKDPS